MKRRTLLAGLGLSLVPGLLPARRARAQAAPVALRIATLAPRGSTWFRVYTAWGNSLRAQTDGALTIDVQTAGLGDEASLVEQLRAGRIDGAGFTAIGIGLLARPLLVLQAPGVFEGYAALDRARTAMDGELRRQLADNGLTLLGWGDWGQGRIFSNRPIARPADFAGTHPWVMTGDPLFPEILSVVGATGVTLGIGQVMTALNDGRVDTVVASSTAVSALQWHTRLTHVTQQSNAVLVGATLVSKERFDALSPALQAALTSTAAQAHTQLQAAVRREDERAYATLSARMTAVDASPHEAEWRRMAQEARDRLVGRVYTRAQLDAALAAGRG